MLNVHIKNNSLGKEIMNLQDSLQWFSNSFCLDYWLAAVVFKSPLSFFFSHFFKGKPQNFQSSPPTAVSGLVFKVTANRIMRLCLFTKNEKHFLKFCASVTIFHVGKQTDDFIHPFSKQIQNRFFSKFVQFWKNLVTKNVLSANSAIPRIQLGEQGGLTFSQKCGLHYCK